MSLVWRCDRCGRITDNYPTLGTGEPDVPEDWYECNRPVRGSQGAKSQSSGVICDVCDDDLYEWWKLVSDKRGPVTTINYCEPPDDVQILVDGWHERNFKP